MKQTNFVSSTNETVIILFIFFIILRCFALCEAMLKFLVGTTERG